MSEIKTTSIVPYVSASTGDAVDKLQFSVLLTSVNDSSLLSITYMYGGDNTTGKQYDEGPLFADSPETQTLINAITADNASGLTRDEVERLLIGGTVTTLLYGPYEPGDMSSPTKPPYWDTYCTGDPADGNHPGDYWQDPSTIPSLGDATGWTGLSAENLCLLRTGTTTVSPSAFSVPVILDNSYSSMTTPGSALVTYDSTHNAFHGINSLVNTPSNLDGLQIAVSGYHVDVIDNPDAPADSQLDIGGSDIVIPAINENYRQAKDNFNIIKNDQNELWFRSTGFWGYSQTINHPGYDAGLRDQIYAINPEWDIALGRAALLRLNTIPVLSSDKIMIGENTIDPDSQVNLLEAVWTQWKYLNGITETIYGIPSLTATPDIFRDTPPINTLAPQLTGFSLIENINTLYTLVTGVSGIVNTGALDTIYVNVTGDGMTGPFTLSRDPVQDMEAVNKRWIVNNYMPLSNVIPTITAVSTLRLLDTPQHPLDAVSKEYLDCKLYNFEATFPRISELDLKYVNLTGDHMAGYLHYSHETDLNYGTIAADATDFNINVSFDNKTFQTIRLYRTDVTYHIKVTGPNNGKATSLRIINMDACQYVKVQFSTEYRFLRTYKNIIPGGYSGIFSFTAFGNRDCDVYCAYGLECTPPIDKTCNTPSCDTKIGEISLTVPQLTCTPVIFTGLSNTPYNIALSQDYCFKIEDTAINTTIDGVNYIQSQLVFTDGTTYTTTVTAGQAPRNSTCTFIWDIGNTTGDQHKFYFGQENTYITRSIDGYQYRITYVGMGSFVFKVEYIGVAPTPGPTPTPITYTVDVGWTHYYAWGDEGFNALIEAKRFESSQTGGAIRVKYRTVQGAALSGIDYKHVEGDLYWYDNDYSTRNVVVPIFKDQDYLDHLDTFFIELYDPEYISTKTTVISSQVVFDLSPERINPIPVAINNLTSTIIGASGTFTALASGGDVSFEFTGGNGKSATITLGTGTDVVIYNNINELIWDYGGSNQHTFTATAETITRVYDDYIYTITFDGFGSLMFTASPGVTVTPTPTPTVTPTPGPPASAATDTSVNILATTDASDGTLKYATDTGDLYISISGLWRIFDDDGV